PIASFFAAAFFPTPVVAFLEDLATLLVAPVRVASAVFFAARFAGADAFFVPVAVARREDAPDSFASTSRKPASKRARISAISSALSLLRWLAAPLAPRLLPVSARDDSFCRRTRSRARSRAARARVMRVEIALPSRRRRPLARLSS